MALLLTVLLLICGYTLADDGPLVEMPLGKVRGHTLTSRSGREFLAFTGLPYAKPPVRELRFQPPQPMPLWRGVRDATGDGGICIQYNPWFKYEGVEDCLYLDVYTHNTSRRAPVLVMFHGGAFYVGTKSMLMPTILMDEDIVVVRANYRLGIFGFLTFETKDLAGNQGLKDQAMVLRWVKQNIGSFGGDPDKVTLTGCSAGGASVHSHTLSPLSRGLFHRAISGSGTMYNPWAVSPPGLARTNAQKLMTLIGCPTEPAEALPCVMEKDARLIVDQTAEFFDKDSIFLMFSPTLEEAGSGGFLEGPISKWENSHVPLILIVSSAEGLFMSLETPYTPASYHNLFTDFIGNAPFLLHYWASASNPEQVSRRVKEFYFPGKDVITKDDFTNITNMASDAMFNHGIMKGASKHNGDAYFLWFDFLVPGTPEYDLQFGSPHCAKSGLLWELNIPGMPVGTFQDEKLVELSRSFVKSIVQFMESGVAKVPRTGSSWKKWTAKDHNYLLLDRNGNFSMKSGLLQERYKFWDTLNFQDKFWI